MESTSLTSYSSDIVGEGDEKGKVMGIFRSLGALSRALGPTIACAGRCLCISKFN